jgi:phosphatidylserine/phosphatidylglycerophosphate/cardiolipin synthase-like enzyme
VKVDQALATVLERLSDDQVHALAAACERLPAPDGHLGRAVAGAPPGVGDAVTALTTAWRASPDLSGAGVSLALRIGLTARQSAHARRARPVWTGPGTIGEQRLTAAVLHELLADGRERILLVSFAAYTLSEVAADLEAAVQRGCRVDVVFETIEDSAGAYSGPHRPFAHVAGINRWRWPAEQRDDGAVLHAKLLVVDGSRAFVGSANLTARALQRNLEVGLVTRDPDVATQLEDHVRGLMSARILIPTEDEGC